MNFAPCILPWREQGDYQTLVARLFDRAARAQRTCLPDKSYHTCAPLLKFLLKASKGADVLVSHPLAMALPLVAEKLGIPRVATVLSPMLFVSPYDPPVIPDALWLNRLRRVG